MQPGDIVRIKEEKEVMVVIETWCSASDQVNVLRGDQLQYVPVRLLEVISESR